MLKKYWDFIIGGLGAVIGLLWYFLTLKNREARKYKTAVEMANTQREADLVEIEIKQLKGEKKLTKTEIKKLDEQLKNLSKKRENINEKVKNMTSEEIIEFWNKE